MSETAQNTESSGIATEYRERVEEMNECILGLSQIEARSENGRPDSGSELALEAIELVEQKMGSIGMPLDPEDNWPVYSVGETESELNSPGWQGDYVRLAAEWRDDGLWVNSVIMPNADGRPLRYYVGYVDDVNAEMLEEGLSKIESYREQSE